MNVIRSYKQGIVVGETDKSYHVKPVSTKAVWWPKSQCSQDFYYYEAQLAMHLTVGYIAEFSFGEEADLNIATVAKLSAYVPALILADRKLDEQLRHNAVDWDKVFAYDVAQAAGRWLANHPKATVSDFAAKLEELIA